MKYKIKEYADIKETVARMELEDLLRCVVCPNIDLENPDVKPENTLAMMFHTTTKEKAQNTVDEIIRENGNMKLFAADLEFGAGRAVKGLTRFPSFMACGIVDDEDIAYRMGEVCAAEAKEVGYSWAFAPCVDIIMNHDNPIVSTRGVGEDADKVIKIGGAYMRGMQDNGIIATLKHFPGDGICDKDQHLTTPENSLSFGDWDKSYGRVYRALIEQGVKAIMPGHISLPAYDVKDEKLGIYPPATLSKRLLTDLLKNTLGFAGIIISDAVNMGGFCGFMNYYDACCTFLEAGGDCLLFAHMTERFINEMKSAVKDGRLHMHTLKNRAYRMLCFAREFSETIVNQKPDTDGQILSDLIVERACKVVLNRNNTIPFNIKQNSRILHLMIQNNYASEDVTRLTNELRKYSGFVDELTDPGPDVLREIAENNKYDLIICTVGCQVAYGINTVRLHGTLARNMMMGWTKFDIPVVFVNYGNPWVFEEYGAVMDSVINTYGCTEHTAAVVVNKILGK